MDIVTVQPHPALKKYIDFYYLIKNDSSSFSSVHYSFPHTANVVSIYKQAKFSGALGETKLSHDPTNNFVTIIQAKCQLPLKVSLLGPTDRISIWFNPFGINQFIKQPLSELMSEVSCHFSAWDSDPEYHKTLKQCFSTQSGDEKIALLEAFLLNKLCLVDTTKMQQVTDRLLDFQQNHNIETIAEELNLSVRTLNRHFKQMLGVSLIEYRNIARFRHSLTNKLFNDHFNRLTEVAYQSNFYD
ncbi:MAG: AraC family transcriptional regulator, partial [Chitinophagaceae bacterium]